MSFFIAVTFFVSIFLMLYRFAIIILLAGTFFKERIRSESNNLLYVFNTLTAWCCLLTLLAYGSELFMAWYGQNSYEWYAFKSPQTSWKFILVVNLFYYTTGLLLFVRKLRINRFITLLFLLSCSVSFLERIYVYITSQFGDYLPSWWETNYENMPSRYLAIYALVILSLAFIYLRAKKKGRLPFPSVFLK